MHRGKNRRKKRHLRLVQEDEASEVSARNESDKWSSAFEIGEENVYSLFRSLQKMINPDQEGNWSHPGVSGNIETLANADHLGQEFIQGLRVDDLISQKVYETLMRCHEIDATQIGIKVSNGIVLLTGKVTSRWMKKMAKRMTEDLPGVREVRNELTVVPNHDNPRGPDSAVRKDLGIS